MGWLLLQAEWSFTVPYLVGTGIAFVIIMIYLGERLATRSLIPVIVLAGLLAMAWPVVIVPAAVGLAQHLRHARLRAPRRYRHIVRLLLRRKSRLRRAGEALYRSSAARLAERTASTRRRTVVAGSVPNLALPLTRCCAGCRKAVPNSATYCRRCGRKMDA